VIWAIWDLILEVLGTERGWFADSATSLALGQWFAWVLGAGVAIGALLQLLAAQILWKQRSPMVGYAGAIVIGSTSGFLGPSHTVLSEIQRSNYWFHFGLSIALLSIGAAILLVHRFWRPFRLADSAI